MTKEEAKEILTSMTKGDSLLRHARTVELLMEVAFLGEMKKEVMTLSDLILVIKSH